VDTDLPKIEIIRPDDFYVNNTGEISFRWYSKDRGSNISMNQIRWDSEDWLDLGLSSEYTVTGLVEGIHHVYIRSYDNAGNHATAERVVIVDINPPELEIMHPEEGGLYNDEFNVQWTGSDLQTGISSITLYIDGNISGNYKPDQQILLDFSADGSHEITLVAADGAGNQRSISRSFRFDITQPTVVSFDPSGNGVGVGSALSIGFSEEMDRSSIILDMEGVEGNFSWEGKNLTFRPHDNFEYGKKYSLRITGFDPAGNPLVPFDWYFTTEYDLTEGTGLITGRIVDGTGKPIPNASIRVKTGERSETNETGWFSMIVKDGDNHLIASYPGFSESKFDFSLETGQILEMGDIPIKDTTEIGDESKKDNPMTSIIIAAVVLIVLLFAFLMGWQVKKTRDASRVDFPVTGSQNRVDPEKQPSQSTREYNRDGHTVVDHFEG
jgi:hypothetical protein